MYLAVHTRPDMAYTVNLLSRFNTRPTYAACQAALHTLLYLDNTVEHGIVFPNLTDEEPLRAYSDADWAGDLDTSRSTTLVVVAVQQQQNAQHEIFTNLSKLSLSAN